SADYSGTGFCTFGWAIFDNLTFSPLLWYKFVGGGSREYRVTVSGGGTNRVACDVWDSGDNFIGGHTNTTPITTSVWNFVVFQIVYATSKIQLSVNADPFTESNLTGTLNPNSGSGVSIGDHDFLEGGIDQLG